MEIRKSAEKLLQKMDISNNKTIKMFIIGLCIHCMLFVRMKLSPYISQDISPKQAQQVNY